MFIVFMGLDGTGKSTQSFALKKHLIKKYPNSKIIHHCSPVFQPAKKVKAVLREKLIGKLKKVGVHKEYDQQDERISENTKKENPLGFIIAFWILINGFIKSWVHVLLYRKRGLIYDRCFLDDYVKAVWRFGGGRLLGSKLIKYVPVPDRCIVFRISPEISYQRKKAKNCTVEEYEMKGVYFNESIELARKHEWQIVEVEIDDLSIDDVSEKVRAITSNFQTS